MAVTGTGHGMVDASCAFLVLGMLNIVALPTVEFWQLVLLYNILAFASQPLIGFISDRLSRPKTVAVIGLLLTAAGLETQFTSLTLSVALAGIGNACFHIGAGSAALQLNPGTCTAPGLFVAPGAIGLACGTALSRTGYVNPRLFTIMLAAILLFTLAVRFPKIMLTAPPAPFRIFPAACAIVLMLLASVAVRSLAGFLAGIPLKPHPELLLYLAVAAAAGKAAGGLMADRWGWIPLATGALLLAALLFAGAPSLPMLAIPGMAVFQMTMPVTLTAMNCVFPRHPGTAFGLTCLALFVGAWPLLPPPHPFHLPGHSVEMLTLIGWLAVTSALLLLSRQNDMMRTSILGNFHSRSRYHLEVNSQEEP